MIGSEVFTKPDITAMLAALVLVQQQAGGSSPHDAAYRNGFAAAILAVATALHISAGEVTARLPDGARRGLLR
jgi:hypothetical protein